jgi:hypothetical protein
MLTMRRGRCGAHAVSIGWWQVCPVEVGHAVPCRAVLCCAVLQALDGSELRQKRIRVRAQSGSNQDDQESDQSTDTGPGPPLVFSPTNNTTQHNTTLESLVEPWGSTSQRAEPLIPLYC